MLDIKTLFIISKLFERNQQVPPPQSGPVPELHEEQSRFTETLRYLCTLIELALFCLFIGGVCLLMIAFIIELLMA